MLTEADAKQLQMEVVTDCRDVGQGRGNKKIIYHCEKNNVYDTFFICILAMHWPMGEILNDAIAAPLQQSCWKVNYVVKFHSSLKPFKCLRRQTEQD